MVSSVAERTEKQTLTTGEVADLLDVSPTAIRNWTASGLLKARILPGGHRRYDRAEVERFRREHIRES